MVYSVLPGNKYGTIQSNDQHWPVMAVLATLGVLIGLALTSKNLSHTMVVSLLASPDTDISLVVTDDRGLRIIPQLSRRLSVECKQVLTTTL